MIICQLCRKPFRTITSTHLKSQHGLSISSYNRRFGTNFTGIAVNVGTLQKSDPRYRRWRASLMQRPPPWNRGYTKYTHPSVSKTSRTFKRKNIDNFAAWRRVAEKKGWIRAKWPPLKRNGDFAELFGVVLGDGHIHKFPRTEEILISANSNNPGFVKRYSRLAGAVFGKRPSTSKVSNANNIRIRLYQKMISKRIGIPAGDRSRLNIKIPAWIWRDEQHLVRLLRGLFEAEGSLSIHKPTYTYNFQFSNKNQSLLKNVAKGLKLLGYHPEIRLTSIRLRKKAEVEKFRKLIRFRNY